MVDSTIGMGVIEELARWANSQAQEKTRELETIERICVKPVERAAPEDYRLSSEIKIQISDMTALKSEYDNLQGFLRVEHPVPKQPEEKIELCAESIKDLADTQDARRARLAVIKSQLKSLPPAPPYSAEQLQSMLDQQTAGRNGCGSRNLIRCRRSPPSTWTRCKRRGTGSRRTTTQRS